MASLKITAAAAALFRQRPYRDVQRGALEQVTEWLEQTTRVLVEFEGPDRRRVSVEGVILSLLDIPSGDYMILEGADAGGTLWPIRLDDILKIGPRSRSRPRPRR